MDEIKNILNEIVKDYGLKILEDHQKFKAVFADYSKGEYSTEKDLFSKIIEISAAIEIRETEDIPITKKALVKKLYDKYFLDEKILDNYLDIFIPFLRSDYTVESKTIKMQETKKAIKKPVAKKTLTKKPAVKKLDKKELTALKPTEEIDNELACVNCGAVFLTNNINFCSNCGYPRQKAIVKKPAAKNTAVKRNGGVTRIENRSKAPLIIPGFFLLVFLIFLICLIIGV